MVTIPFSKEKYPFKLFKFSLLASKKFNFELNKLNVLELSAFNFVFNNSQNNLPVVVYKFQYTF